MSRLCLSNRPLFALFSRDIRRFFAHSHCCVDLFAGLGLHCIVLWGVVCIVLYALYAIALYGILAALTRGGGGCGRVWERGGNARILLYTILHHIAPTTPHHTTPQRARNPTSFQTCKWWDPWCVCFLRGCAVAFVLQDLLYTVLCVYPAVKSLDFVLICCASALRRLQ